MPPWTGSELQKIAPCFPNATEWRYRFEILGGIPRYVLEVTTSEPTKILNVACIHCSLEECSMQIELNSTIPEKSKGIHSLIHMNSRSPFTVSETSVCYASPAALKTIAKRKKVEARREMKYYLSCSDGSHLKAELYGYVRESYALELLEKGGTFACRQMMHDGTQSQQYAETTLVIPSSRKTVVDKILANQTRNQLHVPNTKNDDSIDAWIPEIGAFRILVGKTHPVYDGAF
jgi:hypothetical protein